MNTGQIGEEIAAEHYRKSGLRIIATNYIFPKGKQVGEIDVVALDDKNKRVIFVEVKTRTSNDFGQGIEAVDTFKQRKLVKAAKLFIHTQKAFEDYDYQIDVVEVRLDKTPPAVIIIPDAINDFD
jgi:putative endonuclease